MKTFVSQWLKEEAITLIMDAPDVINRDEGTNAYRHS